MHYSCVQPSRTVVVPRNALRLQSEMNDMVSPPTSNLGSSLVSDLNIGYLGRSRIHNRQRTSFANHQTPFVNHQRTSLTDARWAQRSSLNPEIVGGVVKAIDFCAIVGATVAVFAYQHGVTAAAPAAAVDGVLLMSLLAAMLFTTSFQRIGGYKLAQLVKLRGQLTRTAAVWVMSGSVLLIAAFFSGIFGIYPTAGAPGWITTTLAFLLIERSIASAAIAQWARRGYLARNVVIVGAGEQGERLIAKLQKSQDMGMAIRGVFDDRGSRVPDTLGSHKVLGTTDALLNFARCAPIDEVIITLPLSADQRVKELIEKLSPLAIDLRLSAEPIAENFGARGVSYVGDVALLGIVERPITSWNAVIKWFEDKVLSGLLLMSLAPIMLLIALLIKLESRGSVFFIQERFGFNNNIIRVLKFRTMYTHCSDFAGAARTVQNDPRVTPLGRALRALSLDELPQLLNVLKGDMSLVGPRPHPLPMAVGLRLYCDAVEKYAHRHRVKPGITGWAQVNGCRGEIDTIEKARARVEYDLAYIDEWSPWLDLKILALTVTALLRPRNAY
jgi:Undecaprenyl-phosphate glucose phosphotransferase